MSEGKKDVDACWETFWKPLIYRDGVLDLELLKKELFDFHFIMGEVSKVYCHITGNRLSKITYKSETVINAADEHYEALYEDKGGI